MNRFIDNPVSSYLGLFYIVLGTALLIPMYFYDVKVPIPYWVIFAFQAGGILLLFAKDKLIDILTFGLSSLIEKFKK